jgi:hypothetical protein
VSAAPNLQRGARYSSCLGPVARRNSVGRYFGNRPSHQKAPPKTVECRVVIIKKKNNRVRKFAAALHYCLLSMYVGFSTISTFSTFSTFSRDVSRYECAISPSDVALSHYRIIALSLTAARQASDHTLPAPPTTLLLMHLLLCTIFVFSLPHFRTCIPATGWP